MSSAVDFDGVAAVAGLAAASSTYFVSKLTAPFPPGMEVAPKTDIPSTLRGFLLQHAYVHQFGKDGLATADRARNKFGDHPYGTRALHVRFNVVANPHDIEAVMCNTTGEFGKGGFRPLAIILPRGLVGLGDKETHRQHRAICNPAFSAAAIRSISRDSMSRHAIQAMQVIQQKSDASHNSSATLTVRDLIMETALNIIGESAFRVEKEELSEVGESFNELNNGVLNFFILLPWAKHFVPSAQKVWVLLGNMKSFMRKVVAKLDKEFEGMDAKGRAEFVKEGKGQALLDYLVLSGDMSERDLLDHAVTFMFAGHETSSNTIQWALAILARDPVMQAKLFEEIQDCVPLGGRTAPADDDLKNCTYLDAFIKESMRVYPVVATIPRYCFRDSVLPGTKQFIPVDSQIHISVYQAHRDVKTWGANATEFVPERWLEPGFEDSLPKCAFMPFGVGTRNCIGKEFAMAEIRMLLSLIVRNFELQWPEGQAFPNRRSKVTISPVENFKVTFVPREE